MSIKLTRWTPEEVLTSKNMNAKVEEVEGHLNRDINANKVLFDDGKSFQKKYDDGDLTGPRGPEGNVDTTEIRQIKSEAEEHLRKAIELLRSVQVNVQGTVLETQFMKKATFDKDNDNIVDNAKQSAMAVMRNNSTLSIVNPAGGIYHEKTQAVQNKDIEILFPFVSENYMINIEFSIFDYESNKSVGIQVAGYTFTKTSSWINTTANFYSVSEENPNEYTVKFGKTENNAFIRISNSQNIWGFPTVFIKSVQYSFTQAPQGFENKPFIINLVDTNTVNSAVSVVTKKIKNKIKNLEQRIQALERKTQNL